MAPAVVPTRTILIRFRVAIATIDAAPTAAWLVFDVRRFGFFGFAAMTSPGVAGQAPLGLTLTLSLSRLFPDHLAVTISRR
jgi:hypothetical protein